MSKTADSSRARAPARRGMADGLSQLLMLIEERVRSIIGEEIRAQMRGAHGESAAPREKAYLTNREACEYLGLSRSTMARLRSSGALKYSKVGSRVFYALTDIEALLASRTDREG